MNIYYKHIESGTIISLKKLKEYMNEECNIIKFTDTRPELKIFSGELDYSYKIYAYDIRNIPFSDDFETLSYDFTYSEIEYLRHLLYTSEHCDYVMINRIGKKLDKKKRDLEEEGRI